MKSKRNQTLNTKQPLSPISAGDATLQKAAANEIFSCHCSLKRLQCVPELLLRPQSGKHNSVQLFWGRRSHKPVGIMPVQGDTSVQGAYSTDDGHNDKRSKMQGASSVGSPATWF
eukprot:223639-Amphidinium_carterae.1